MLTASVMELQPIEDTSLPISHGVFAYAAALDLLGRLDTNLPKHIHDPAHNKPITVSPVSGGFQVGTSFRFQRDRTYQWRVTGLNEMVSSCLRELSPEIGIIRMARALFQIVSVCSDAKDDPNAGQSTYRGLLQQWRVTDPPKVFPMEFLTPTTFRKGSFEEPFPSPYITFASLADTWNTYAQRELRDIKLILKEAIMLANWSGETRRVELGSRRTVGFIGRFTYRSVEDLLEVRRMLGLLTDYAFYAGVGWQTTHGLGQVRCQQKM